MLAVFNSDDSAYLNWLVGHPEGYVLNRRRGESMEYMVLHRSRCRSISAYAVRTHPEAFTGRAYLKVCASDISSLSEYVRVEGGRQDGSFSSECSLCRPRDTAEKVQQLEDENLEDNEIADQGVAMVAGFLDAVRELLLANPAGLTPQEIRRLIKAKRPSFYGTESHHRNVARGHYADLDHALLAQIYSSCRNARDIVIDRSTKPLRYRLGPVIAAPGAQETTDVSPDLKLKATSTDERTAGRSPSAGVNGQPTGSVGMAEGDTTDATSDFDLDHARNRIVKICLQLWRSTQEGDPPRAIAATVHHLRTCEIIPYVTASLMLTVCAIRNAAVYSEWRPSQHEVAVARHANEAIAIWWRNCPLGPEEGSNG